MPTSLVEGNSLLAVDVGATTTRAVLFDVVEGVYRFVSIGQAPSTAEAPFKDIGLGVREAIEGVQDVGGDLGEAAVGAVQGTIKAASDVQMSATDAGTKAVVSVIHAADKIGSEAGGVVRKALLSAAALPREIIEAAIGTADKKE